ncbi:MAG TPA: PEGA domain-containing protein, partial [Myxococcales bacterium]|nr:PEGA domain-containing protein [Myxococcales bacterium]
VRGELVVNVQPPSARVRLDGKDPVPAPAHFRDLTPGSQHELLLSASGYEPKKVPVQVAAGENNYNYELTVLPSHGHRPHTNGGSPAKPSGDSIRTDDVLNPWGGN